MLLDSDFPLLFLAQKRNDYFRLIILYSTGSKPTKLLYRSNISIPSAMSNLIIRLNDIVFIISL